MRFLLVFFCLSLYACQDPAPSPESPVAESDTASPTPDLLQPDDPTGIALQAIVFSDSAQLAPQMSSSPQATYYVSSFAPHSTDEALNSVVNTALANLIAGEEAPIRTKDLRKVIVASVKNRLLNYKKQAVDTTETPRLPKYPMPGRLTFATPPKYFTTPMACFHSLLSTTPTPAVPTAITKPYCITSTSPKGNN